MGQMNFDPMIVPLREDQHGAVRVGGTRVLLDLVVGEFERGATPEEIVEAYDALKLADVYTVIAFFLRNPQPIHEYLRRREEEAGIVRKKIEASQPQRSNLRDMLMARAEAREKVNASPD
jgi:uncharacterized protein (DUF433 family)